MFKRETIDALRAAVKERLSEYRFIHTLGVVNTAIEIGKLLIPEKLEELECAALLHDIAKEMPTDDLCALAKNSTGLADEEDIASTAVLHSVLGPVIISSDFPSFATEDIISSVRNHTTGNAEMSIFDEIIFISDYIEPGRHYASCVKTRNDFFEAFSSFNSKAENLRALHIASFTSLKNTVEALKRRGERIHSKTLLAIDYFSSLI